MVISVTLTDVALTGKLKFPFFIASSKVFFTSVTLGLVLFVLSNSRIVSATMEPELWGTS